MNQELFFTSLQLFEWIGTVAFALAGAMVAVDKRTDLFGVVFLAITTAMGGGIVRDTLMGRFPAAFFTNHTCLILSVISALIVFIIARCCRAYYLKNVEVIDHVNQIFDALGLGAFAVSGTQMAIEAGYADNVVYVIFLGMTTAIGGGIMRDLFLGQIPFVFRKYIYALAAISGAYLCYMLYMDGLSMTTAMASGLILTFLVRMCAMHYHWNLPKAIPD